VNGDLVFGGVGLALAIVYYVLAATIPESQLADAVGPQGLPKIYAVALGVLSLLLIARSIGRPEIRERQSFRFVGLLLIGAVYIVVIPYAGYVVSLTALIAATCFYQSKEWSWRPLAVAAAGAIVFWILFVEILGIQHPAGIWPDLF
jgi:putative tricarboxylic transport membrane protein